MTGITITNRAALIAATAVHVREAEELITQFLEAYPFDADAMNVLHRLVQAEDVLDFKAVE